MDPTHNSEHKTKGFNPKDENGEEEIRTPEAVADLPVFETGAFNRSATSPAVGQQ
jgi:hypothetical protein